ncbi:homoserine O-acetyltransferase [Alkalibacillus flavidus]|uniref:Homoserine O-acetyltransferase n=1 Tax=Alkalibacillus flavidus TaxID=546021 RepID=A0ABV2KYB1_9BACI
MNRVTDRVAIPNVTLESGTFLEEIELVYERAGTKGKPIILVCHALTGNHITVGTEDSPGWWRGLIHEGGYVDLDQYEVITFNTLGGCHGSTGPLSLSPETGQIYGADFPTLTVRDLVEIQFLALKKLGVHQLHSVMGSSLGGMQVLEWAVMYPWFIKSIIPLAITPQFSDYAIAFNHISAQAIRQDPNWQQGKIPKDGLGLARSIGMITYRSAPLFQSRFNREHDGDQYQVVHYLNYQAEKIAERFDANSYLVLLEAMNSHDLSRGQGDLEQIFFDWQVPVYAFGFEHDLLYPPEDIQKFIQDLQAFDKEARYIHVDTAFGHDGFLVEFDHWGPEVEKVLQQIDK